MSSSAVYRYFGSKEEIIHASAEEGVARVRGIFVALLDRDPVPTPAETLSLIVAELRSRTNNPDYDMTRLALQTWAEALRDPVLQKRARGLYLQTLDHIAELAGRWRDEGYIPPNSDTNAVAATLFSLMHGLIVMHHLVDDVPSDALRNGLSLLGAAVVGPYTLPATPPQEATAMTDIDLSDLAADRDGSQPLRGYLASPPGIGPWPAVVMIHEIFGLDEVMRGHADRLAGFGYLTLAVDLFSAGSTARCLVATMTAMMRGRGRAFADISAAHDYLAGSPECTGKIGVIGFCIGGGFALLTANNGFRRGRSQLRPATASPRRSSGRRLPDRRKLRWPRPFASRCRPPARRGPRQSRRDPRRQGIPRRQPRFPQRRRSRPPRATPPPAGSRHRSGIRVSQGRLGQDRKVLRHPPTLTQTAPIAGAGLVARQRLRHPCGDRASTQPGRRTRSTHG